MLADKTPSVCANVTVLQGCLSMRPVGAVCTLASYSSLPVTSLFGSMQGGIATADRLVTVSPGYAQEIQTVEGGWDLHPLLSRYEAPPPHVGLS